LQQAVTGSLSIAAVSCGSELYRLTARVRNLTGIEPSATRDAAQMRALASTHLLFGVRDGQFISLIDPPEPAREAAASCRNQGAFPVLVGGPDTLLASPIILYDYPQIAPESPGDLFDSSEIDEILTLRILTLTDEEKREMRAADPRAKALLDRTEALGQEELMKLHGVLRAKGRAVSNGVELGPGHRVRLRPRPGGDIFDVALAGKEATVSSVEEDFEGRVFLALTIDEDPGRDLGMEGKPGHRFFFRPEEVEPLP
jgi:hydrogenase maturation protease